MEERMNQKTCQLILEKQEDLLKELQRELGKLKHENSELKFELQLALKNSKYLDSYLKNGTEFKLEKLEEQLSQETRHRQSLEGELEKKGKALEDSKWFQAHLQNRLIVQAVKLEEYQKQLVDRKNSELNVYQLKVGSQSKTHSRVQSGTRSEKRRGSFSLLPDNYKEPVATLPPISHLKDGPAAFRKTRPYPIEDMRTPIAIGDIGGENYNADFGLCFN